MTGEKDRFKTLEKLGKFEDESLKTPEHDEMVLQLREPRFLLGHIELLRDALKLDRIDMREEDTFYKCFTEDTLASLPPNPSGFDYRLTEDVSKIINKRFEHLKLNQNTLNGIWRCYVSAYREISQKSHEEYIEEILRKGTRCEVPVKSSPNFIAGYWDLIVELPSPRVLGYLKTYRVVGELPESQENSLTIDLERIIGNKKIKLCFEVKPSIQSFGATLRQINTYKEFERGELKPTVYLYTRDSRFDSAFESEGIKVIHPPKTNGG